MGGRADLDWWDGARLARSRAGAGSEPAVRRWVRERNMRLCWNRPAAVVPLDQKRQDTGTLPTTFDPNYVHKRVYMYNLLYIILYIIQEHFQRPLNPIIYTNTYCIIYYTVYYIYQYSITFLWRLSCVNTSTSQTI